MQRDYVIREKFRQAVEITQSRMPITFPKIAFFSQSLKRLENDLKNYDLSPVMKNKKYPFIWFEHPIRLQMNPRTGVFADVTTNVIIANWTDPKWTEDERQAKNYIPILFPIRNAFIKALTAPKMFMGYNIQVNETQWTYWGNGKANMISDYVDVIELRNLKLSINNSNCK